ncbi:uncharacterized protein M421DRAFT_2076 [Didymella exigua CBS 183.55]|uniref:DUF6987 domain-containing protein n=1 Tax=Didymella exigua CBS 183.55 TaxID=1150837 RepID=A0A6A5RX80_9PLEO|nr:uncharacterized protein M421DRAFT_2076 [Didymella exigua CBS 183.55]KAF1932452.1 hypothetical protein M421DRAFT_2076 [Didymella exigua CBS 183.55]
MPSPAAGKSDTPRTPTKLGRKPQQSAPKLNKPQSQVPDTSDVSEKAQSAVEDTINQAQDTAEDTAEQVKGTAEDTKDTAEDTAKDTQKKAGDTTGDTKKQAEDAADDAEDTVEDTTGKVSQKGDELSEAEPKPIDDDEDEEAEETEDDATQKAGDDAEDTVDNTEDDATDTASKAGEGALSGARGLAGRASNLAGKASKDPKGAVEDAADQSQDKSALDAADDATETAKDSAQEGQDAVEDATDDVQDKAGDAADDLQDKAGNTTDDVQDKAVDGKVTADDKAGDVKDTAEDAKDGTQEAADDVKDSIEDQTSGLDLSLLKGLEVDEEGLVSKDGKPVGRLVEGDAEDLAGYPIGDNGEILDDDGDLVGRCELLPEDQLPDKLKKGAEGAGSQMPPLSILKGLTADKTGQILNEDGDFVGHLVEGDPSDIQGKQFNEDGEILDDNGNVIARAQLHPDAADLVDDDDEDEEEEGGAAEGAVDGVKGAAEDTKDDVKDTAEDTAEGAKDEIEDKAADVEDELPGVEALEGLEVNSEGEVLNDEGEVVGQVGDGFDGDVKDLKGLTVNEKGEVVDSEGNVLGSVELAEGAAEKLKDSAKGALDIRILDGLKVNKKGKVLDAEGEEIGELAEGEVKDCAGKTINDQGEVLDKEGKSIGKVQVVAGEAAFEAQKELKERLGEVEPEVKEVEVTPDIDVLDGLKVNKKGQVLDEDGEPIGELAEGDIEKCAGKKINEKGQVLDKDGNVIGKVKTLPKMIEQQVNQAEDAAEEAEDAEEDAEDAEEGAEDAKAAAEGAQDAAEDAAEDAEEDAEEAGEDNMPPLSILDGLTVNKSGKLIDGNGNIVGELVEGDAKKLSKAGITSDAEGQFWDNKGKVIGRAQTVPQEDGEEEAPFAGLEGLTVVKDGYVEDRNGNRVGQVVEGDAKKLIGRTVDEDGDILDKKGSVVGHAERVEEEEAPEEDAPEPEDLSILKGKTVNKQGNVIGDEGVPIGRLVEGNPKELNGRQIDEDGQIWNDAGKVIGRCELIPENERETKPEGIFGGLEGLRVIADGKVADEDENVVGEVVEGNAKRLVGLRVDEDGDILDKFGNVKGHAEPIEEGDPEEEEPEDLSALEGLTLNKQGKLVNQEGIPIGRLVEGNLKELSGRKSDGEGLIHNDTGKVVGRCELIPENERESKPEGIFGGLEGLRVIADGKVADADDNVVGVVVEGDAKRLIGLHVDEDGDILDKHGNVKGHAEPLEDEEEAAPVDLSSLDGLTLNKQGYLVNNEGIPVGKLVEGNLKELAGRKSDGEGLIHGDTGKVVGRCELIPDNERVTRQEGPFAGYEGLRVVKDGFVEDNDGNRVGQITEGDAKKLVGHSVDEDGDIIDKYGNVKGHAEPFEEEEEEVEEVDLSALAGCTINKAGNVVDSSGTILGRVSEGDPATMVGKKVDGKGQIWDNAGNIVGKAELVHGASSGPEGPFAGFDNNTVAKDGTVQTADGSIIGRVIEGDIKKLTGHHVDEDGDINDKNGNVIGKAERWEPEEKERRINPMSGMRVNKEGDVRDENGDVIGRLTAGDLGHCAGLEIDDNGYVIDNDGNKVGEVTLLGNIQEEEIPEDETDEERQRREDSELANKMAAICQQTLERVQPVMKQITEHIEKADRTPRDELDEEELVNNVKPLIEEGGRMLNECNGSLRGLDPDGRIAAQAKGRQQTGEATPEEYKLADCLKELTSSVVTTIDNAKKKISDMPHAKKKLNPLWSLLTEPLFQIIAAVGLLLTGVLNLVGKLLNGLGLGGLVNGLLGGLGINKLLSGLGLGGLFGGDDKKKKSGGGVSNIPLVGGLLGGKK